MASVPTAKRAVKPPSVEHEELRGGEEQHEQQVPDDHVHQQSQRERDGAQHEHRDELDRRHDDVERPRHPGREERVAEERERVLADAGVDEGEVRGGGEHERQADRPGARDVDARDDAREVGEQHEEEDRRDERQEPLAVLLAEQVFGDVDADEVETHLDGALEATGHELHAPGAEPEDQDEEGGDEQPDQHDAVELEELVALEEDRGRLEVADRGTGETTAGTVIGREREQGDQGSSAQGSLQNRGGTRVCRGDRQLLLTLARERPPTESGGPLARGGRRGQGRGARGAST